MRIFGRLGGFCKSLNMSKVCILAVNESSEVIFFWLLFQDIRSFFTVFSKKPSTSSSNANQLKKPSVLLDSDDDDVIKGTPEKATKVRNTKRKVKVLSSDSEDDGKSKKKSPLKKQKVTDNKRTNSKKPQLKPISIDSLNRPIKQTEVKSNLPEGIEIGKAKPLKMEKRKKSTHVELGKILSIIKAQSNKIYTDVQF